MSLELHDVTIKINALPRYLEEIILFENFNLEIQQGEVSTIMGPSGSGKSTLISYIKGEEMDRSEFKLRYVLPPLLLGGLALMLGRAWGG